MTDDSAMEEGRMEEIEARCNKSSPGPWEWVNPENDGPWDEDSYRADLRTVEHFQGPELSPGGVRFNLPIWIVRSEDAEAGDPETMANYEFLKCARTDIPDLLAEVRRLRAENDALKQQLQALRHREYPDFAPGPWSECGGFIVDANDAPVFEIVSEESHHKIAIRNFMDQLQAMRQGDHPCRELVQEIAESKICWSDWAGDYIQWTEDVVGKARKALGLKDE